MRDSIDLRHFPHMDPPDRRPASDRRQRLNADIEAYLEGGGEITQHAPDEYQRIKSSYTQDEMRAIKKKLYDNSARRRLKPR